MVEVAVGEDNRIDLIFVRLDRHRENTGVHEDRAENIRVRERPLSGNPPDLHAQ
jgi:hypothetical protein